MGIKTKRVLLLTSTMASLALIIFGVWPAQETGLVVESNKNNTTISINLLNEPISATGKAPFEKKIHPGFWEVKASTKTAQKRTSINIKAGQTKTQSFNFKEDQEIRVPAIHSSGALSNSFVANDTVFGLNPNTDDFQSQLRKGKVRDLSLSKNSLVLQSPALKVGWLNQERYVFKDHQDNVNIIVGADEKLTSRNWLDFATFGSDAFLLSDNGQVKTFNLVDQSQKNVEFKLSKEVDLSQILVDSKYIYLVGLEKDHQDQEIEGDLGHHESGSEMFVLDKKTLKEVAVVTVQNLIKAQNQSSRLFLLISDRVVVYDFDKKRLVPELDLYNIVDLVTNPSSEDIYLLNSDGEVWSFDSQDMSYFLVSNPPKVKGDTVGAVYQSAVVDSERILFGVYWYDQNWPIMMTYFVDLK